MFILFRVLFQCVVFMKPAFQGISFFDEEYFAQGTIEEPFWKKGSRKNSIAQGTIEYLVIVGVIVVLSLVVVGLVSNSFDSFSNISSVSSRVAQSSGLISISEAVVDSDGNGLVSLGNSSGGLLIITKLSVEGVDVNYEDVSLSQGESKTFSLSGLGSGCSCVGFEGQTKTCEVIVYAQSEYGLEKQFTTNVSVDCVPDAVATNQNAVVEPLPGGDVVAPLVLLLSPVDGNVWGSSSTIVFDFNVWDESDVNVCSLLVDGVDVNSVVPVVGLNSVSYGLGDANYLWDVNCVDEWGNSGNASSDFDLSVDFVVDYEITNCLQLQDMNLDLDGAYVLMNDVNCYDDTQVSGGYLYNGGSGFLPVGDVTNKFTGTLDGNYHTINELYINRTSTEYIGLFGYTEGAALSNFGIVGGTLAGMNFVGALIGQDINSTISRCYSTTNFSIGDGWNWGFYVGGLIGDMNGGTLDESYTTGNVSNAGWAGGLVGIQHGGAVSNCYSTGNVFGARDMAGGISSSLWNLGTISNCYSTGNVGVNYYVVGGIAGQIFELATTIDNCFTTGDISGDGRDVEGGILASDSGTGSTVTNSYYTWTGSGSGNVFGTFEAGGDTVFYNSTHAVYTGSPAWDFVNVWDICEGASYPFLQWENRSC